MPSMHAPSLFDAPLADAFRACSICGETKNLDAFIANRGCRGGRTNECKACAIPRMREAARRYRERWHDVFLARARKKQARMREASRAEYNAKARRLYRTERVQARIKLRIAIRAGRIVRPGACESCSVPCAPHGHHRDYSKPYEVEWLCSGCHGAEHRK